MNILSQLQGMHQDGVLWKAQRIWRRATNPDAQVEATDDLVKMLHCISNEIKRNSYVDRVVDSINDDLRQHEEKIKELDARIKEHEKDLLKLLAKKKKSDADLEEEETLPDLIRQMKEDLARLRNQTLPKLAAGDVKKLIREEQEAKERAAKAKQMRDAAQGRSMSPETVGLMSDFEGNVNEAVEYGVATYRSRYYSRRDTLDWVEISNFTMRIIYHVDTEDQKAYRLIALRNVFGEDTTINIDTDDLTGVNSFKKVIARKGKYTFRGNDSDLARLTEYLQKDEKSTKFITVLGYHPRGKFYAFANGLVDCANPEEGMKFYPIDEYGIVNLRDRNYFIPAMSKMYAEKDHLYKNEKRFVYIENRNINFKLWSELHYKVYKRHGLIGQLWYVLSLFMDVVADNKEIQSVMMLFLYGQRGAGKGRFADSLMCLFGYGQPFLGLGAVSTPKGLFRKLAQFKNSIIWFDEYKNNIKKDFIEALKNIFDLIGYTRASMTNDFQNETTPVNSAALISGQEMPTIEPALFSRVVLLQFEPGKNRTDEEKSNFRKLKNLETHGLSAITCEILQYRPHFIASFPKAFDEKLKKMYQLVDNKGVDDRFVMNIAILAAIREVMAEKMEFSFSQEEAETALVENLRSQFAVMQGNDDLGKWWHIMEMLTAQRLIRAGRDFKFEGDVIWLKIGNIHSYYVKELVAQRDHTALPKPTLEHYLKNDKEAYVEYKKVRFGSKNSDTHYCHGFRYSVLQERYHIELQLHEEDPGTQELPPATLGGILGNPQQDWSWDNNAIPKEKPF